MWKRVRESETREIIQQQPIGADGVAIVGKGDEVEIK